MLHITEMGGHSGCKVQLIEDESGEVFVRKISSGKDYNERLYKQAEKQEKYNNDMIYVPEIIRKGKTNEGLFYFDMEYVQGITLAEFIRTVEVNKIRGLAETIIHNVIQFNGNDRISAKDAFRIKIEELNERLTIFDTENLEKALGLLKNHDWSRFENSPCHGDLTLENIIIKGDRIFLIDFLDSFYDCWILDVGTLLQDVQTFWAYRNENILDINTVIRLITFRDILLDEIRKTAGSEYIAEAYYALLLKLVRVYPYADEIPTRKFLEERIVSVMEMLEGVVI